MVYCEIGEYKNEDKMRQGWNSKYQRILILKEKGMLNKDIAVQVKMNPVSITKVLKKPEFLSRQAKFEETVSEKARSILSSHAVAAAKKVVQMMHRGTNKQKMQYEAAKEILYQIGCKPIDVIDDRRKRDYSPEEIKSALGTMLEVEQIMARLGKDSSQFLVVKEPGEVIDATPVEVIADSPDPFPLPDLGCTTVTSEVPTESTEVTFADARETSPA